MKLKRGHRYRDRECKGLYIQVSPSGSKSWLLRFELNHKERYMGLGEYPLFSLKAARRSSGSAALASGRRRPIANRAEVRKALAEQAHKAAGIPTSGRPPNATLKYTATVAKL